MSFYEFLLTLLMRLYHPAYKHMSVHADMSALADTSVPTYTSVPPGTSVLARQCLNPKP